MANFKFYQNQKIKEIFMFPRLVRGDFGVEIEVEGRNLPEFIAGWDTHREGSLRGEAKEYVTCGAVNFAKLTTCLENLTKEFADNGTRINHNAYRASTHIHVNVRDLTLHEVIGMILIFSIVEPLWLRMCGPTRDGNLFCLPSYDCGDMPGFIRTLIKTINQVGAVPAFVLERGKYSAMNTAPLGTLGTLEFRTFPCSVEKETILRWAEWCHSLRRRTIACQDLTYHSEIQTAWDNPLQYAEAIFGAASLADYDATDVEQTIRMGVETAYEIYRVYVSHAQQGVEDGEN